MASGIDTDSAVKVKIVLNGPDDWCDWIKEIKAYAYRLAIWDHFDPDQEEYPEEPERPKDLTEFDDKSYRKWQYQLQNWKDKTNAIAKVEEAIRSSIAIWARPIIEDTKKGEMIKALKEQFKPSERYLDDRALKLYNTVSRRSPRKGRIEAWLDEFTFAYAAIKKRGLLESQDRHVKRVFLQAIGPVSPIFSDLQLQAVDDDEHEDETFYKLLARYRRYLTSRQYQETKD